MCVCHITRWLVVIWLIVSLVHLQANSLLQYSAAELLKLRHHVPAPLQPPERGHDIPPGIAFQPRRRYVHRGSRRLLSAMDLVEVNPLRAASEAGVVSTVTAACDIILSCCGWRREGSHAPDYHLPSPEPIADKPCP
uniref:Secreted protein n=1 Tax=Knipowitschia caucasica TaxID=637954 RepID=A0AAV2LH25_KNICA